MMPDATAKNSLSRLRDLENYTHEAPAPYEEFEVAGKTYYFTPGGSLYRKDPGTEEVGEFLRGYLTEEVWHHRTGGG
jgi:hypothetical protein